MKWNADKLCFIADDGSRLKLTKSLAVTYALPCQNWSGKWAHDALTGGCAKAHARWKCYLSKELNKV